MIAAFMPDATSVLQTLLAVSVLMAIVLVARRPVARHFGAGVAYALWAIPVVRLVLPPLHVPVSLMALLRWPSAAPADMAAEPVAATTFASISDRGGPVVTLTPSAPLIPHPDPLPDAGLVESLTSPQTLAEMALTILLPGLLVVWAGGALIFFGLGLWRQREFMQTVKREAVSVSPRLQRIARDVGEQVGLKRLPVIASSFISSGPLVTGLARPVVLLPAWFETDYDEIQQRAALAHELTHVRRGDLWALQLAELFRASLWFNPLVYYAHRAFRTDQEAACDADVLKTGTASPHAYGATLIKAVKSAAQERPAAAASLPLTHALKERLSRMTHPAPTRTRRLAGGAAATVLGIAALAATSSVTANAGEPEHREQHELKIDGSTVYLDGMLVPDRQIVILGEPFAGLEPSHEFDAEISRLSEEMAKEGARIGQITARITAEASQITWSPEDDAEFQALMDELKDLPLVADFNKDFNVDFTGEMSDEDWEAWGEKWEQWGEQFEERAEQWADAYEARADAIEARAEAMHEQLEPQLEQMSAEIEARMEAKSAKLEALIEQKFGPDFEARIEATSDAIDELVGQCRDTDLADGETRVMTRSIDIPDGGKREVKIACVKGDATALRSAKAMAVIDHDKSLCPEEKQSFRDHVSETSELEGGEE